MASTYSADLKLELMATGENAGTWGTKTNTNLNLVQQAVAGYESINVTTTSIALAMSDGSISQARNAVINFAGTLSGATNITIPDNIEKVYIIKDATTHSGNGLTFKTVSGTGIALEEGKTHLAYSDGTNINQLTLDTLPGTAVIPSGTIMLFQQTAAPTGFTKLTSENNKALRVVSGTASTGGSNSFTDAFNSSKTVSGTTGSSGVSISGSTASHTLSVSEIPSHSHTHPGHRMGQGIRHEDGVDRIPQRGDQGTQSGTYTFSSTGGGGGHSHGVGTLSGGSHSHSFSDTFNLNVQYVDIILASKD
jgi:hypothetical protein